MKLPAHVGEESETVGADQREFSGDDLILVAKRVG